MEFCYHGADRDVLILRADAELDSYRAGDVSERLQPFIDGGVRKLVIDCTRVGYMSSIGIAAIIRIHKRLAEREGLMRLAGVQPPLARLLEITRLGEIFPADATVDDACRALRSAAQAG